MSFSPSAEIPVRAVVWSSSIPYTQHAPGPSVIYSVRLMIPEGAGLTGDPIQIARPVPEPHGKTVHVWPLKPGTTIKGKRIGTGNAGPAEYDWELPVEEPLYRRCDGSEVPRTT